MKKELIILERLNKKETRYSDLLQDKKLIKKCGGLDSLVQMVQNLAAKNCLELVHEYDEDEGEDIVVKITNFGQAYLEGEIKK
jgi:signal recognition particle GTPase